jgi:hypothetical protein
MDPVKRRRHCDPKSHILMHSGALTPLGNLTAFFVANPNLILGTKKENANRCVRRRGGWALAFRAQSPDDREGLPPHFFMQLEYTK